MLKEKILLIGEPMGLFTAVDKGELHAVECFNASVAGAEYNVAVGLARLNHKAAYFTKLGTDVIAQRIINSMEKNHISTSLIKQTEGLLTGFMMKGVNPDGDPAIAYFRKGSAASAICPQDIDNLDLYMCTHVHLTGIFPAISSTAMAAAKRLAQRAKDLDITISFDPNLRPQLWRSREEMVKSLNSLAEGVQTVLPGIEEGKILTGSEKPKEIADFYHKAGAENVVVKLGKDGAYYSCVKGGFAEAGIVPAFPVSKIVDTVGAGDGFAAGVISGLREGLSLKDAAFRGTVIGAVQITNKGDNEGLPTLKKLNSIIAKGKAN